MKKFITYIFAIMIGICGFIFVGCNTNYDNISLSFSVDKIELTIGEQDKYFLIKINEYTNFEANFNFNFDTNCAKIISCEDFDRGEYRVQISPLVAGTTNLTITLLEAKKNIVIPVVVGEKIQSFTLSNSDIYCIRGNSIKISKDMFSYFPQNTLEKDLIISYGEDELKDGILNTDENTPSIVQLTATSKYNSAINMSFNVRIVEDIDISEVFLIYADSNIARENEISIFDENSDVNDTIELVENSKNDYFTDLSLVYDIEKDYEYIITSDNDELKIDSLNNLSSFENVKSFRIQNNSLDIKTEKFIYIKVKYKNFDNPSKTFKYKVVIVNAPEFVKVNNSIIEEQYDIFTNSKKEELNLFVSPSLCKYNSVKLNFYKYNEGNKVKSSYADIRGSLSISVDGNDLIGNELTKQDLETKTILVQANNININKICIEFVCVSDFLEEGQVFNSIVYNLKKGTTLFSIDNKYENSTIYVQNGTSVNFDGFTFDEDAFVGDMNIYQKSGNINCVTVSQNKQYSNKPIVTIDAQNIGKVTYIVMLQNKRYVTLNIIVTENFVIDDFRLMIDQSNNDYVANIEYNGDGLSSLSSVAIRGNNASFVVNCITGINDNELYSIDMTTTHNNIIIKKLSDNKSFEITTINEISQAEICCKVTYYEIDDFSKTQKGEQEFKFAIKSFEPIGSINLEGYNVGLSGSEQKTKYIDIYNESYVGYTDKDMSIINLIYSIPNVAEDKLNDYSVTWSFSCNSTILYDELSNLYYQLNIGSEILGNFYPQTKSFVCNGTGTSSLIGLSFAITVKYYEYGFTYSSSVNVTIKNYEKVSTVWLYNNTESIYLDSIYTEYVLYPYLLPENATNKDFAVFYKPDEGTNVSAVQLDYDTKKIIVRYAGTGGGSGTINIVPTSWFTNKIGEYTSNQVLKIRVSVADGTETNPIHIRTIEEFLNINNTIALSKHYVIDTIINANNMEIVPVGELTGSITGAEAIVNDGVVSATNVGGIINYKIKNDKNNHYGLFTKIAQGASVSNLTLQASVEIEKSEGNELIGALCGENNGLIKNVYLSLLKFNVSCEDMSDVNIGGLVGKNNGVIVTDINESRIDEFVAQIILDNENSLSTNEYSESSKKWLKNNYAPRETLIVQFLQNRNEVFAKNGNVGGICGENTGLISFRPIENMKYYNYFGTNVVVYLSGESATAGSVSGNNTGVISSILSQGELSFNTSSNIGGIAGSISNGKILKCISRVFLVGNDNVGGIAGSISNGDINNCFVQATDDNTRIGTRATLIYSNGVNCGEIVGNGSISNITNIAETFFTREKVEYVITNPLRTIENFYGDIYKGIEFSQFSSSDSQKLSECIATYNTVAMMKIAKNREQQSYLKNENIIDLPNIWKEGKLPQVTITSLNSSVITVMSNGKLNLLSCGTAKLKIVNSLNAVDNIIINIYVTSFIKGVEFYISADKTGDKLSDINVLSLLNDSIIQVYPKFIPDSFETQGHMLIALQENDELYLEVKSTNNINIEMLNRNIYVTGENEGAGKVNFSIYYKNNNETYYYKNGEFVSENATEYTVKTFYSRGIYDINIDKTNMKIVPSDIIRLHLEYSTYNADLKPTLELNIEKLGYTTTIEDEINKYFIITKVENDLEGDAFSVDYIISINEDNIPKGIYNFTFKTLDNKIRKTLRVEYYEQPLNNVQVKNYCSSDNKDIQTIDTITDKITYKASYSMVESDIVTAGKTNILRLNISPWYSNYSYIEITNDESNYSIGGVAQFSLLENDNTTKIAKTTSDGYYLNNGIRILKNTIVHKSEDILVLYKIQTNVNEGDIIKLNISFYDDNGNLVYETIQKQLSIKIDKEVKVKLSGKISETDESGNDFYRVARGYTYNLDVKLIGYSDENIFINSSSSNATILKENGSYYLKIADNITYMNDGSEGLSVIISYYGRRFVDGKYYDDEKSYIKCIIVEYVINTNSLMSIYNDNELALTVGSKVDIRQEIVNKIQIEYSNDAQSSVQVLKNSMFNNATYWYKLNQSVNFSPLLALTSISLEQSNKDLVIEGYYVNILKVLDNPTYSFGISAKLKYVNGFIEVSSLPESIGGAEITEEQYNNFPQEQIFEFNVAVRQQTSSESPWPIFDYEDLLDMTVGGYYILLNNITLPSNFRPITTNIASLDGNGYNICFDGVYNYSNSSEFGIFSELNTVIDNSNNEVKTIIKNLGVEITKSSEINFINNENSSALVMGLICATNEGGIITNCSVKTKDTASLRITNSTTLALSSSAYIGGLVGINKSYISNCQIKAKIDVSGANFGGLVGTNTADIVSCYIKDSYIKNSSTNANNTTGGIVNVNRGTVNMSYISGIAVEGGFLKPYCTNTDYILKGSSIVGGFVYNNEGTIANCYSNIPIISSSKNSGFVAINSGLIEKCYSTCMLGNSDTENYPFIINDNNGSYINCFYIKDDILNKNTSNVNDLYELNGKDLKKISLTEFLSLTSGKDIEDVSLKNLLNGFLISSDNLNESGIWFVPKSDIMENKYNGTTTGYIYESDTLTFKGEKQKFLARRLELVSPNMLAYSKKTIYDEMTTINEETGETVYFYIDDDINCASGSKYNPLLISSAREFEKSIIDNSISNINKCYYRLICDLDYRQENIGNSVLYKTIFAGHLEGNEYDISGYSISTSERVLNAGLFSQVGTNGVSSYTTIQNINLKPYYINLPNAYHVGALSGYSTRARIYNISVEHEKNTSVVILGRNVVGGIIGLANRDNDINYVSSSISVNSYFSQDQITNSVGIPTNNTLYNQAAQNYINVSYAGAVIGIVGESSKIKNISLTDDVVSVGMICGLVFGGITTGGEAQNINICVTHSNKSYVRAGNFGGLIVGDLSGKLSNVTVSEIIGQDQENNKLFRLQPSIPVALGSVVGIIRGGELTNVISSVDMDYENVENVGGIVGLIYTQNGVNVNNCIYNGKIVCSRRFTGGIIARIIHTGSVNGINLELKSLSIVENKLGLVNAESIILKVKKLASFDVGTVGVAGIVGCYQYGYDLHSFSGVPIIIGTLVTQITGNIINANLKFEAQINIEGTQVGESYKGTTTLYIDFDLGAIYIPNAVNMVGGSNSIDTLSEVKACMNLEENGLSIDNENCKIIFVNLAGNTQGLIKYIGGLYS